MHDKHFYFKKFESIERTHAALYEKLSKTEKQPKLKSMLEMLADFDRTDTQSWSALLGRNAMRSLSLYEKWNIAVFSLVNKIFGPTITVKMAEKKEGDLFIEMTSRLNRLQFTKREQVIIKKIIKMDRVTEKNLTERMNAYSGLIDNIKDVTLGVNDGLVEVFAATVGLGAALNSASLVFIGGLIVAVSGTLSMSGGNYLSTEYESATKKDGNGKSPLRSAAYMGIAYIIGAAIPLIPFAIGFVSYSGIIFSAVLTVIVLSLVSIFISIISDTRIKRRLLTTLAISLGAATVTIIIGTIARSVLHIAV